MPDTPNRPGPFIRFNNQLVGYLLQPTLPTTPGLYEYTPSATSPTSKRPKPPAPPTKPSAQPPPPNNS